MCLREPSNHLIICCCDYWGGYWSRPGSHLTTGSWTWWIQQCGIRAHTCKKGRNMISLLSQLPNMKNLCHPEIHLLVVEASLQYLEVVSLMYHLLKRNQCTSHIMILHTTQSPCFPTFGWMNPCYIEAQWSTNRRWANWNNSEQITSEIILWYCQEKYPGCCTQSYHALSGK